jgi:tungstate transport system substrate-binding protein
MLYSIGRSRTRLCVWLVCLTTLTLTIALLRSAAQVALQPPAVRLALVNVPDDIVRPLLPMFQAQTGRTATIVYTGRDPFGVARDGKADLVIAHYGHEGVEPFVTSSLGKWPRAVFANQMVLLGPAADPANVRGLADVVEAFGRIARTKSKFLSMSSDGGKYLEQWLWIAAGDPSKGEWYVDADLQGPAAARAASQRGAYVLWGLPPFLRLKRAEPTALEPLVVAAPELQRMMVSVVVNAAKVTGANEAGAAAFEAFLLTPKTQAWIRVFRYPDFNQQAWWPAGRHNSARE